MSFIHQPNQHYTPGTMQVTLKNNATSAQGPTTPHPTIYVVKGSTQPTPTHQYRPTY